MTGSSCTSGLSEIANKPVDASVVAKVNERLGIELADAPSDVGDGTDGGDGTGIGPDGGDTAGDDTSGGGDTGA